MICIKSIKRALIFSLFCAISILQYIVLCDKIEVREKLILIPKLKADNPIFSPAGGGGEYKTTKMYI